DAAAAIQARLREGLEWQDYFLFAPAAEGDVAPRAIEAAFEYQERAMLVTTGDALWSIARQEALLEPFPLRLVCIRQDRLLHADLVYDTSRFDRETGQRLLRGWLALVVAAAGDPDRRIDRLPMLDEEERT